MSEGDRQQLDPESVPKASFMSVYNVGGRPMASDEFWFKERTIFLPTQVNDATAYDVVQKILALDRDNPNNQDITLVINSPGGTVVDGMSILAAMDMVSCDIRTISIGQAASMGSVLLAHGTKGKREIAPNSRVLIHQVSSGGMPGFVTNQRISMDESERLSLQCASYLAADSGQEVQDVLNDFKEDLWLNAEQAIEYGLADRLVEFKRPGVSKSGINPPSERAARILAERRAAKRRAAKGRAATTRTEKPGPELAA